MSNELDTRKLNAIVGSALRALVESGASDEALGAFAHDHRAKVSQLLGLQDGPPQQVDLRTVVTRVLEEMGVAPAKAARQPAARVIVELRGAKTSISIKRYLMDGLVASKGGQKAAANAVIEELANAAPEGVRNRSGWVAERVEAILQMSVPAVSVTPASKH